MAVEPEKFFIIKNASFIESFKDGLWENYNIRSFLDSFSSEFIEVLYKNLKNDMQIKIDEEYAKKINREAICRKKAC